MSRLIIRKLVRMDTEVIRFRVVGKLNGFNIASVEQGRLADTVHAIHNTAIRRENNRKSQIGGLNQTGVFNNCPTRRRIAAAEPKRLIEFQDRGQRDMDTREALG